MNYCTKCQSYYQTPGTCNCYATVQPPIPIPLPYPQPYPYPMPYIGTPWWLYPTTTGTVTSWGGTPFEVGNNIDAKHCRAQFSYTTGGVIQQ